MGETLDKPFCPAAALGKRRTGLGRNGLVPRKRSIDLHGIFEFVEEIFTPALSEPYPKGQLGQADRTRCFAHSGSQFLAEGVLDDPPVNRISGAVNRAKGARVDGEQAPVRTNSAHVLVHEESGVKVVVGDAMFRIVGFDPDKFLFILLLIIK